MALSERDRRALVLGGVGLLAIGVYVFGIEPAWSWYDGIVAEHESQAARLGRVRSNEAKADYYTRQIEQWEKEIGVLSPPRPYSEQVSAVTEKIIGAAQPNGTELKGISPAAPAVWPEDPKFDRAAVLVDAEAAWPDIFKFIDALYRTEGVLSVEQLEFAGDPKKGGKLTVKLNVSVLVLAPEESQGGWSR
jgi:hypothetical protein